MVEGLGEIRFHFQMAAITERGQGRLQKLLLNLGMVYGVAIDASYIILQVLGPQEVGMLFAKLVATQATLGRLFTGQAGEADDLGRICRLGMFFARTMTSLASLPLRALVLGYGRLPVRTSVKTLTRVFMAGLAGIGPHVLRRIDFVIVGFLGSNILRRGVLLAFLGIAALGFVTRGFPRLAWW